MNSVNQTAYPRDATRLLAGVLVPDTPIVTRAIEYAREHCEPYLFNHPRCDRGSSLRRSRS